MKVRKLGRTWWGQRWIESLERFSREYITRLGRGRAYARSGRVGNLHVTPGKVTADVTGSEDDPYRVEFSMDVFPPRTWNTAIAAMSEEARFAAELLAGRMPDDIDSVFRRAKCSLFPRKSHDLETDCSCPDWASPCKHVAAVHYVLGEAFDRDPFLLFELRGRTREQVLKALSHRRSGGAAPRTTPPPSRTIAQAASEIHAEHYERIAEPLPSLRFGFEPPLTPGAILRSAGEPPSWTLEEAPSEYFADIYSHAADFARQMAMGDREAIVPETMSERKVQRR